MKKQRRTFRQVCDPAFRFEFHAVCFWVSADWFFLRSSRSWWSALWSARQNTFDLLRDKSTSTMELVLSRIEQYLKPAEDQLAHLAKQFESGAVDVTSDAEVGKYLSGALAATPQIRSVVLIRDERRMVFALRHADGVKLQI
ncbi:MAG: hypothetical protein EXQ98_08710, partial [Alphaproteobacteria bacterium]|nr:hypothetical protein [Alphaproteobacteria bacterium]